MLSHNYRKGIIFFIFKSLRTTRAETAIKIPIAFFRVIISSKKIAPNAIAKNGVNILKAELFLEPIILMPDIVDCCYCSSSNK